MPQKKNPDAAELLRGEGAPGGRPPGRAPWCDPRAAADLQQGPPGGQGAPLRRRRHARAVPGGGDRDARRACASTASGMREAASDEMIAATDVADLLVQLGMPFRESHGVVAGLVRTAVDSGRSLSGLSREELAEQSELLAEHEQEFRAVLASSSWLESKVSEGGTSLGTSGASSWRWPGRCSMKALRADFYERPVLEVARRADRLRRRARRGRRRDRRDRGLPRDRACLPCLRRADAAHQHPVRGARTRLRLSLLRHPRAAERRLRARGGRRGGPDPRAGAAGGGRADACAAWRGDQPAAAARAPAGDRRSRAVLGAGQAHAGAGDRARPERQLPDAAVP